MHTWGPNDDVLCSRRLGLISSYLWPKRRITVVFVIVGCGGSGVVAKTPPSRVSSEGGGRSVVGRRRGRNTPPTRVSSEGGVWAAESCK